MTRLLPMAAQGLLQQGLSLAEQLQLQALAANLMAHAVEIDCTF